MEKKKYIYSYAICSKCGIEKDANRSGWCKACIALRYKNKKELLKIQVKQSDINYLQKQINDLKNQIVDLIDRVSKPEVKLKASKKQLAPTNFTRKALLSRNKSADPRLLILLDRIVDVQKETGYTVNKRELVSFIDTIVKRNHFCSDEELNTIIDYHGNLFEYVAYKTQQSGFDQICFMYRDLALLYKEYKTAFQS